jgi:hypothetical protein
VKKELAVLAILLGIYLALALPVTERQAVNWDEQADLDIGSEYSASRGGWVYGSRIDAINVRLPMYSVAVLRLIPGIDDLRLARWTSVVLGIVTILLTFRYVAAVTDRRKAWATCAILATSPYFVYFSSMALTEGDIWITAATAVFVLSAIAFVRCGGTIGTLALLAVSLGLAMSAKISGLAMVPVAIAAVLVPRAFAGASAPPTGGEEPAHRWVPLVVVAACVPWFLLTASVSKITQAPIGSWLPYAVRHPLTRWALAALLLAALLGWCLRYRRARLSPVTSVPLLLLTAALTFLVVPPVHTTNVYILESLWRELIVAGGDSSGAFIVEAAVFHLLVILLKPSVLIGAAMLVAVPVAVLRARVRRELRLPLMVVGCQLAFLATLPWAQARYVMPIFPLLAFFTVDALFEAARRYPRVVAAFALAAVAMLVRDTVLTYPDINMNGYQWTGARYLAGRSTLGYRGIGTTPSDGVEQALAWTCERATPDDTVLTFFLEEHIFDAVCGEPAFRRVDGIREPYDLGEADYVVTTVNTDLDAGFFDSNPEGQVFKYGFYDRPALERGFERGFSIRRAFDVEVAAVWVPRARP